MGEQQVGDVGGRESRRVAEELRARIADGTYPVGAFLPSQRNLAEELEVSRVTVQRALRELAGQGLIQSRQGSGSRVVKTMRIRSGTPGVSAQMSLGALLEEAFAWPEVTLDVSTLTSESLVGHLVPLIERIQTREISPRTISLRMLLPSEDVPPPYPVVKGDRQDGRLTERLHRMTKAQVDSLKDKLEYLSGRGLVEEVSLEVRHSPIFPAFKLYILNGGQALMGPYEVIERPIRLPDSGEEVDALDVLGLGATLTHYVKDDDPSSVGTVFVESWQSWFDSVWDLLAR
ncbi:winged helix-turn-helix domain-containing protein [Streptomyces sp. NPDC004539]|uniref:winged helix-turn-helix domain-containing protein n=1 Tax=Streptomyces sp. NPDC004539 TaxID=3154280 RepID=UPI0033A2AC76